VTRWTRAHIHIARVVSAQLCEAFVIQGSRPASSARLSTPDYPAVAKSQLQSSYWRHAAALQMPVAFALKLL